MNIVFQVNGGVGKNIASTAVIKGLKKKYPSSNIIVIASVPQVFTNNPLIKKVYGFDELKGLYKKYIIDQDSKLFLIDPYHHPSHFSGKQHIIETWFEICGLVYNNETPEIYLNRSEIDYYTKSFGSAPKPIFALHCNGGPPDQNSQYSWPRDIPYHNILDIIDKYKDDYTIIHIKQPWQANYENTFPVMNDLRGIAVLLMMAEKRLLIDSFAQHLAAALSLPSTVCWGVTKPEVFGYKIHDNIPAEPFTKDPDYSNSIFHGFDLYEPLEKLPYWDLHEIFDSQKIIKSLNK